MPNNFNLGQELTDDKKSIRSFLEEIAYLKQHLGENYLDDIESSEFDIYHRRCRKHHYRQGTKRSFACFDFT